VADEAVKQAAGPWWKTLLYWLLGILTAIGVIVGLVFLFKRKSPVQAVKDVIESTKNKVNLLDIEAKIEVAKLDATQALVVQQLEDIKKIEDRQQRMNALANLL